MCERKNKYIDVFVNVSRVYNILRFFIKSELLAKLAWNIDLLICNLYMALEKRRFNIFIIHDFFHSFFII
ncbi:hypothetical protein AS239_15630 [Enterococcus faecium]|nr:hypothetical protein AS239_15630 [Enterococcus faecium]